MPVSIANAQRNVLIDLDDIGEAKDTFGPVQMSAIGRLLVDKAASLTLKATRNLQAADRIASGNLVDSIQPTALKQERTTLYVEVALLDYYKYVDKGRKPGGKMPPSAAIRKWLESEASKQTNMKYSPISRREAKRANSFIIKPKGGKKASKPRKPSSSDGAVSPHDNDPVTMDQAVYLVQRAIKKKGITPSHFWSKAIAEVEKEMKAELGEACKIDIINSLGL